MNLFRISAIASPAKFTSLYNRSRLPVPSLPRLDPERLASVAAAEALTGLQLKAPSLMLASLRLDHLAYLDSAAGCLSLLTWFEAGQPYDLEAFLPAALP